LQFTPRRLPSTASVRRLMHRLLPALTCLFGIVPGAAAAEPKVDFARDVRPILADNCFACHGPDEKARKAELRLRTQAALLDSKVIAPGKASTSEMFARVSAHDDTTMPPTKSGKKLTAAQIGTLKAWIDQGANWSAHWAFVAPVRPAVPEINNPNFDL